MYPVLQKEDKNFRLVGETSTPQKSCCDENDQNIIKAKGNKTNSDLEFLKLKPLKKIPKDLTMESDKDYYYEDGEIKEGNE